MVITTEKTKFDWTEGREQSFNQLKRPLTGADIITYPKTKGDSY